MTSVPATIAAFGVSDVGRKRKHNEDAFDYKVDDSGDEGLFIVADGMGGHAAGEVASKITVETVGEFIAATRQKEEATWPFKYNHELHFNSNRLAIAIEKANERVMAAVSAQPWLKGMGTTVVAGLLDGKLLSLAHVGDSRAYLFRAGQLSRLTDDHSWVHEQVAAGILTEEEAKSHPLKNVVTRALGGGPSVSPDLQELSFETGDVFLFCSDGLTTMLSDEEIRDAAAEESDPKKLCDTLVEMANEKGGVDNITVVAARITEAHEEPEKAKEPRDTREPKEAKGIAESKDSKGSKEAQEPKEAKASKES
jgi:PPM family protein phosphatase